MKEKHMNIRFPPFFRGVYRQAGEGFMVHYFATIVGYHELLLRK